MFEVNEKNLIEISKVFFDQSDVQSQIKFKYDPENKRKFYQVDILIEKRKIIIEYDGPHHYSNIWKIFRDKERYQYFQDLGYKIINYPYYCSLTSDMAKHIYGEYYSDQKYKTVLKDFFKTDSENEIFAPGLHTSKETPANFVSLGIERFLEELSILPKSQKHQIIHSLKLYLRDFKRELIIPDHPGINELMKIKPDPKYLNYYYVREQS